MNIINENKRKALIDAGYKIGSPEDFLGIDYMIVKKYSDDLMIELRKIPWWRMIKFLKTTWKLQATFHILELMLKDRERV